MAKKQEQDMLPLKATDIDAVKENIDKAVNAFAERWISLPQLQMPCEVMGLSQLRDAMGLYVTFDIGDPWPQAEKLLLQFGFRWHNLGGNRVMFLREREDCVEDTGWEDGETIE